MKIIEGLAQGSPEWHAHRNRPDARNASDASAMMGVSKYQSRSALLHQKYTGIVPEVTPETQALFDRGHLAEEGARPHIEQLIGQDLYPVVATSDDGYLSASFDGMVMDQSIDWEHKLWSESLAAQIRAEELEPHYYWQLEQQLLISGAQKAIFTCSNGTPGKMVSMEYFPVPGRAEKLLSGWKQFDADLAAYTPPGVVQEAVAAPISELPALVVELVGEVKNTNLTTWHGAIMERIRAISTDLQTDEDFVNADKMVKFLEDGEKKLDLVKQQALAQTATIDQLFRTIDSLKAEMKTKRLALDKTVTARKESIKTEIMNAGKLALTEHIAILNQRLGKPYMPPIPADFAAASRSKKTVKSLREGVDNELLRAKMEASAIADRIEINLHSLRELAADYAALFPDTQQIVLKANDDLVALIKSRIADHKAAEEKRLEAERERIRAEEAPKPEAKVKAEQDDQRGKNNDTTHAQPQAMATPQAPLSSTSPIVAPATLNETQALVASFLKSREWGKGEEARARAIILEFLKFTAEAGRRTE